MTTPRHCTGFEQFRELKSFICKCPECGAGNEIFSDEFDKTHVWSQCGKKIDFTKCTLSRKGDTLGHI